MKKKHRITYNSDKEDAFCVHTGDGIIKFEASPQCLYRFKMSDSYMEKVAKTKANTEVSNVMDTVAENRLNYTQRQFERAKEARKLYHNVGTPTVPNFKLLLKTNMIANCPVTSEDVDIAEKIFGPSMSSLKGKSTRTTPKPVRSDVIQIPKELVEKHHDIELCMDTMFINSEGMLTAIDRTIKFRSLVPINSKAHKNYYKALDVILRKYNSAGFVVKIIHCDGEYKAMMDQVKDDLDIDMNYSNPQDHVPEAERNNRTIKERFRAATHRLPFKKIPKVMIRYLAMVETDHLNYFPVKGGISSFYGPRTILGAPALDYNKHCVIPFGAYVLANHSEDPTNDNTARKLDCIYLRPAKNLQGGHELMDLNTGTVITRGGKITEIPITKVVIKAVEDMAEREGFKSYKFKNRHGVVFFDSDWIAGVDYEVGENENAEYIEEVEDDDYEPDQEDEDNEDYFEEVEEEIDQNEIDELLAEGQDQEPNPNQQNDNENDQDADAEQGQDEELVENEDEEEDLELDPDPEDTQEEDVRLDEDQEMEGQPRRSTRARTEVERLVPTMQGKTYLQAAKEGLNKQVSFEIDEAPTVIIEDDQGEMRKLEYSHNLVAQVSPNPGEDVQYGYDFAMLIARTMCELSTRVDVHGASFVQQYILKKGLQKFGESGKAAATKEMDQLYR